MEGEKQRSNRRKDVMLLTLKMEKGAINLEIQEPLEKTGEQILP